MTIFIKDKWIAQHSSKHNNKRISVMSPATGRAHYTEV